MNTVSLFIVMIFAVYFGVMLFAITCMVLFTSRNIVKAITKKVYNVTLSVLNECMIDFDSFE